MVKVSVIIPCFNGFHLMNRCLKSLEEQSFKNFEVIVIDDCSTDDTYKKLIEYKTDSKLNIIIMKNSINSGPGESRNSGIKNAAGEWIAFCDSDDWYDTYFLEKMLKRADEKSAEVVMCDYNYANEKGNKKKCNMMDVFSDNTTKNEFIALAQSSLCSMIYKKTLFNNIQIPKFYNAEDVAIIPLLLAKSKIIAVEHEALYNYFVRTNSLSSTPTQNVYQNFIEAFKIIEASIKDKYSLECEYIGINTILYGATLNAFKAGVRKNEINIMLNEFYNDYPKWIANPYMKKLDKKKKIYLKCINLEMYMINRLYAELHNIYVNYGKI